MAGGGAGVVGSREGMEGRSDPEPGAEDGWPGGGGRGGAGVAGSREGLEGRSDTKKVTAGAPAQF